MILLAFYEPIFLLQCGEMAVVTCLLEGKASEWGLLKRHPEEDLFGVQLAAGHPDQFARVGELIESHICADFVDLNLGCPLDIICNKGAGASLMQRDGKLRDSLYSLSYSLRKAPITVKMRTGWDEKKPFAHELVRKIQKYQIDGLAAIMVHGRSRLQRYSKDADWDYITRVVQNQKKPADDNDGAITGPSTIPIIGNGDIMSYHDYQTKVLGHPDLVPCAMLGRGALIKPWLPTEIKEQRQWDISSNERMDILKDFVRFGLEHWGSDQHGVNNCRRFLLEWLSFLHRYVPIGILDQTAPPQRMNQRPPQFFMGRNDLETLFLSDHCSDWVKISELLLGPVPDGFRFEPKHKGRAYKAEG
jgi:tRNA-dihydrouridine synthase 3